MKRRFHHTGYTREGDPVFVDDAGKNTRAVTGTPTPGKPIPLGTGLSLVEFAPDGEHAVMEDVVSPGGPPQVATDSYRTGWDRTFN